jgi:LPXTG-motif cell wall-anchored protein
MTARPAFGACAIVCLTTIGCSDSTRPPENTARIDSVHVHGEDPTGPNAALVGLFGAVLLAAGGGLLWWRRRRLEF